MRRKVTLIALFTAHTLVFRLVDTAAAEPVVQILAPSDGYKLREEESVGVRVRVQSETALLADWRLVLSGADGHETEIAAGTEPVDGAQVAEIAAGQILPGGQARLMLEATLDAGQTASATVEIRRPSPTHAMIPLDTGNFSRDSFGLFSIDAAGRSVAFGGPPGSTDEVLLLDTQTGATRSVALDLGSTEAPKLSPDGRRFYYKGTFPGVGDLALGYYDLHAEVFQVVARSSTIFFTTSHTGSRVAYHDIVGFSSTNEPISQYFLYDEATGSTRQLTDDPAAVIRGGDFPRMLGTVPLLSADGNSVVIATSATLGLAPEGPTPRVHVFVYDVPAGQMRHVAGLPEGVAFDVPALSRDGRWLSFSTSHPGTGLPPFPALLDVSTGELTEPIGGVRDFASFDSVVSGDGSKVVISTRADLDPSVGNADQNMELFLYDRSSGEFSQLAETVGGVGPFSRRCESVRPKVSADARVIAARFYRYSTEMCTLDGPQRHELDGFFFRFVRLIPIRPGNRKPLFDAPPAVRVLAGESLDLTFTAADPDSDRLTFFAQEVGGTNVPPGSVIEDRHDGTAAFRWTPRPEQAGAYRLRVAAFDEGGGEVFRDVAIDVVPKAACTGDCDASGEVSVAELVRSVGVALAAAPVEACPPADADGGGSVSVDEIVRATGYALDGCP